MQQILIEIFMKFLYISISFATFFIVLNFSNQVIYIMILQFSLSTDIIKSLEELKE